MRALLIGLLAVFMTACATPPAQTPVSAVVKSSITGFATLADFGTWEMQLAPAYTRLAVLVHRAARAKEAGRLSLDWEFEIRKRAIYAQALLNGSRRGERINPDDDQRLFLKTATGLMNEIEAILEQSK